VSSCGLKGQAIQNDIDLSLLFFNEMGHAYRGHPVSGALVISRSRLSQYAGAMPSARLLGQEPCRREEKGSETTSSSVWRRDHLGTRGRWHTFPSGTSHYSCEAEKEPQSSQLRRGWAASASCGHQGCTSRRPER